LHKHSALIANRKSNDGHGTTGSALHEHAQLYGLEKKKPQEIDRETTRMRQTPGQKQKRLASVTERPLV
jgi:hypothetical protein